MRILWMESWDFFHFAVRIERRRLVKLHVFESRETPVYEPSKLTLGDEGLFWPFSSFFFIVVYILVSIKAIILFDIGAKAY